MTYEIFPTIFNILSTAVRFQYQEVALINRLNGFFGFDHNIFLLDTSTDLSRYISTSSNCGSMDCDYTPQSVYIFNDSSDNNNTGLATLKEITSKNTFLIVVAESSNLVNNLDLLSQVRKIRDLSMDIKIGVFLAHYATTMDTVEELFRWSWKNRILNIFAAFYLDVEMEANSEPLLNVFSFNPLGTFNLINVTRNVSVQNYFPDKLTNFRLHTLRFAYVYGVEMLTYNVNVWDIVVDKLNASLSNIGISHRWMASQKEHVQDEWFDIVPLSCPIEKTMKLFPILMEAMILVVPHALPYSSVVAYLKSLTTGDLVGYTLFMIVTAVLILFISGYLKTKKISLFQRVADVLNLLMNDNDAIRYQKLYRTDVFVIVPLTFAGLIVVNGIFSSVQSYLTLPIYQPQINTIEDLYKSQVPILANEIQTASQLPEVLEYISQYGGWSDKVRPINLNQLSDELHSFNNSVAFVLPKTHASIITEAQKRLGIKAYHVISETYIQKTLYTFRISDNVPFIERINDIIQCLQTAGLINKWREEYLESNIGDLVKKNHFRKIVNESDEPTVPTVVWYGWIGSVIVFICEIIWNKSSRIIKMFKPKLFKI